MISASRKEILRGFMEKARESITGLNHGTNQGFEDFNSKEELKDKQITEAFKGATN